MNPRYQKLIPLFSLIAGLGVTGFSIGSALNKPLNFNGWMERLMHQMTSFNSNHPEERVYLHIDKPFYKPGESIWFKAYVRNGSDMTASNTSDILHVELINPKGSVEKHLELICKKGITQGDFQLGENAAGGIYKIKAYTNWQKNEAEALLFEKELTVQNVILPSVLLKLDYDKKAFGPGDLVSATAEIKATNNTPVALKNLKYIVQLEGKNFMEVKGRTDADGVLALSFRLPKEMNSNDGLLNILLEHEGKTESISRSIPIELNTIDLSFFPEGGDMLAGFQSRIAFKGLNSFHKPADVEGYVTDSKGKKVATFSSYHQGMGAFNMKPEDGEVYTAHITKPAGINTTYQLPEAAHRGYALSVSENIKDKITLELFSTEKEELTVIGTIRDKVVYNGKTNGTSISKLMVATNDFPMGVIRFTLFDSKGFERAERLAFVNRHKQLKISLTTDKEKYQPREKVKLNLKVTDERGIAMPGNFSISVVDEKVLSFADDRSGNLLSKLFLEADIKGKVEEPAFYFNKEEAKSEQAMDYLLLTSGYRRFTWKQIGNNEIPEIRFQAEKAILAGSVIDAYEGKPLANATIEVQGKTIRTNSDSNGRFTLPFVDLSEIATLKVTANGYSPFVTQLYQYSDNIQCYLYSDRVYKYYERVPAPAGNMEAVRAERPRKAKAIAEDAVVNEENVMVEEMVMEEKAVMADKAILAELRAEEIMEGELNEIQEVEIMNADTIFDNGAFDVMKKRAMPHPLPLVSRYYRARQFPSVSYENQSAPEIRTDFRSTIYWNGLVETDRNGKATLEFFNSDEVSSYRITLEGISDDGTAGRGEQLYYTQLPFSMAAKCPADLISGDKINIPVTLKNNTIAMLKGALEVNVPSNLKLHTALNSDISIPANAAKTIELEFEVLSVSGKDKLMVAFAGNGFKDAFQQEINVQAKGFPMTISLSGKDVEKEFKVAVKHMVPGSMKAQLVAYPSLMTDLLKGIESIIREPYGCFEQTSTSNYPNLLIKRYLMEMNEVSEASGKKFKAPANLEANLDKGYAKLISYETQEKGYEWFGGTPAHEALTAYGLMQFNDMKQVYSKVDQAMIDRTANWLMSRRDGKGGFKKSAQALDQFGRATDDITNAYIVYALSEAGYKDIVREANSAYDVALKSKDAYQLALVANTMFNLNEAKKAEKAISLLEAMQLKDGSWPGSIHSITCSTGQSLFVETTSLAVMALLKEGQKKEKLILDGVKYLVSARSAHGGFASTQGTVLALKALTSYSIHAKKTSEDGTIVVYIDGKNVGTKEYKAGDSGEISIAGLESYLKEGNHEVKVKYVGVKEPLPFTLGIDYSTTLPPSSKECKVGIDTKLMDGNVRVGETNRITVVISNKTADGLPMTMGIVGLPSGMSAQPWQLKELLDKKQVDFYEIRGNFVYLYFRQMAPKETKTIHLDLKAEIPGTYESPASSAYLYYTNEFKNWNEPERVTIVQ
ncbi:MAG: carboxypeptidase regulatory-like domain-containing protein [Sporocytophaga sp.]|uniref:MG2 domain-containing protein n=1 Tax=Sporocytophaga sp. TaxID=2231183 RepID=UPI001B0F230F|nr:MG2 domain-containing protein [Sporocytophaga sp.]MBO9700068.1 carboxypeptidase regulatory-like domain-containing protein [Sporocytophaga sp.]